MGGTLKFLVLTLTLLADLSLGAGLRVQGFSFLGVSNRLITPNGDGKNDTVTFQFSNPRDAAGTVKIFSLSGHEQAVLSIEAGSTSLVWDAKSSGQVVGAGVYIYVVTVEDAAVSGTVVVVR